MENSIALVDQSARNQNGWTIIGAFKTRASEMSRPGGFIAFVRDTAPFEDLRCGTAQYYIDERAVVVFITGHYDLTREEALADLVTRAGIDCRHDQRVVID